MKKSVDAGRNRIARALMRSQGWTFRGRPPDSRTGAKSTKRGIPQAWRDLDKECLKSALTELSDENFCEQFVQRAASKARADERQGSYRINEPGAAQTGLRRRRAHERRVRRLAEETLLDTRRRVLELQAEQAADTPNSPDDKSVT